MKNVFSNSKLTIALLALVFVGFSSCKKLSIKADFNSADVVFTVNQQTTAGVYDHIQTFSYNLDSIATANNIDLAQIKSVTLKEAIVMIEDPLQPSVTFDMVNDANLIIGAPGMTDVTIASKNPVPTGGLTSLPVDVNTTVNLLDYTKANTTTIHVTGSTNTPLPHNVPMRVKIKYTIEGEL